MPARVESMTTYTIKTIVFFVPRMVRMTIMLGNDRAGPARRRERAGPWPMPEPRRP